MQRVQIKVNQKWSAKNNPKYQILITGKKGDKFNCKVLTDIPNVYKDTHKLAKQTLWSKFNLII